jgi:hypothetical protein
VCELPLNRLRFARIFATEMKVEGPMITLIDVIVLLLAYAGLSLGCAALMRVLQTLPQRDSYDIATTKGR